MRQTNQIGKIEIVPVRTAFGHEALNFTVWLEKNIDALADRLGIDLTVLEREKAVGSFNVDLLCEDGSGNTVIIENQLEKTDHDHLGKLLTYMINLDARTAIWVTTQPRPEHERVIEWLNESTAVNMAFYLVQVQAIRIGESPFAPLFTVIAAPDEQAREVGETKKELADLDRRRLEFWTGLLERNRAKGNKIFSNISPTTYHWIATGAGRSGVSFNFTIGKDWTNAELYIDTDKQAGALNKVIFDTLYAQKDDIEAAFGGQLNWYRLDDKRASRITIVFNGGYSTPEAWPVLQENMVDTMTRLHSAMMPRLRSIKV